MFSVNLMTIKKKSSVYTENIQKKESKHTTINIRHAKKLAGLEERNTITTKQSIGINSMSLGSSYLSIITLNINALDSLNRLMNKRKNVTICCP
jgi:hypothetical protein